LKYCSVWYSGWPKEVSHFQESLLNRMEKMLSRVRLDFAPILSTKLAQKYSKSVLNIPCVTKFVTLLIPHTPSYYWWKIVGHVKQMHLNMVCVANALLTF